MNKELHLTGIAKHKRALRLICFAEKKYIRAKDLQKAIEIQEAKRLIESYLLTSKDWYLKEIDKCNSAIDWAKKRYETYYK